VVTAPAVQPPVVPQYNPPPPPQFARTPPPPAAPTQPVKGLPPDAPKLVVNGGTYSERRDMRLAIVNGNVVHEGQNVDGVVVEQIRPEGLVLAWRGSRVHVLY
jgi:general secretion pathway protein B